MGCREASQGEKGCLPRMWFRHASTRKLGASQITSNKGYNGTLIVSSTYLLCEHLVQPRFVIVCFVSFVVQRWHDLPEVVDAALRQMRNLEVELCHEGLQRQ